MSLPNLLYTTFLALTALLAQAAEPVQIVATGGRIGYTFYTAPAGSTAFRHRTPHVLGGPVAEIQIGFMDWMYTDKVESANTSNDVTITHAWLERASTGQIVPLTFNGKRELTLPKDSTTPYWLSDPIASSVWTGAAPSRDDIFWVNVQGTVPEGGKIPVGTPATWTGAKFIVFAPANDNGTHDTAGPIPNITGGSARLEGLPVIFLGRYTEAGHLSVIGLGDSILHGSGDSARKLPCIAGYGYFNRAAVDDKGLNAIATFNLTRHGQSAASFINTAKSIRQPAFLKFANVAVEEYGTNDLGSAGTGDPAVILKRLDTVWTTARGAGIQKIIRTNLLPRTTSTDSWASADSQTPNNGWGKDGKRDAINTGLAEAQASGKIDILLDTLAVVQDPADNTRWLTNGTAKYVTTDGTHVSPAGNELIAKSLRDTLLSIKVN